MSRFTSFFNGKNITLLVVHHYVWRQHNNWFCYLRLPSVSAGIAVVPCIRLSVRPSVCLFICPSRNTLTLQLIEDFSYWPEIWWDDAQYNEAGCCRKWPYLANLYTFHGTLTFSMLGLDQVWGMMTHIGICEEITLWPRIWWHDAMYHEADHYLKWPHSANVGIFLYQPAEGAVVLWMSC